MMIRFFVLISLFLATTIICSQTFELERATPESVGISSKDIVQMMDALMKYEHTSVHSVMVLRHGKVIAETYPAPFAPAYKHTMYSASKTFTSVAVGIAINENRLRLTDRVVTFFPEWCPDTISENLANMTVRDLLIMSSGIEPDWNMRNVTDEWIPTWFRKKVEPQRKNFKYDSIDTYLLSAIVSKVTGIKMIDFLRDRLFRHMNISDVEWELSPEGFNTGGWGLYIQSESLAKFGQLILDKGKWNGKQLIPEKWINEMTSMQMEDGNEGYGYQMWICEYPTSVRADGAYGQQIVIVPEKDMVVVITQCSTMDGKKYRQPIWEMVKKVKDEPLPPNKAYDNMKKVLDSYELKYAEGKKKASISLPQATYVLSKNNYGWQSVSFSQNRDGIIMNITHEDGKETPITLGYQKWLTTETPSFPAYSVLARGRFTGISGPFHIAGTYGWTKDHQLNIILHYVDWITRLNLKVKFSDNTLNLQIQENHQTSALQIEGVLR